MNQHTYSQLIFDKGDKNLVKERQIQQVVL